MEAIFCSAGGHGIPDALAFRFLRQPRSPMRQGRWRREEGGGGVAAPAHRLGLALTPRTLKQSQPRPRLTRRAARLTFRNQSNRCAADHILGIQKRAMF